MEVKQRDGSVLAPEDRAVVHVIDDDQPVLETTALLLQLAGYETRTYGSGKQFLKSADLLRPGCIILDVRMPALSGLEVQQELERRGASMPIVMMTGHGDVATAVRAMKAGAVDFIEKPFASDQLIEAVERALKLSRQQSSSIRGREARVRMARLSPRECQVLQALMRGGSNKTIAGDLGLSPRTVEMHRAHMMDRLRVRSLPEALRLAYDAGLNAS